MAFNGGRTDRRPSLWSQRGTHRSGHGTVANRWLDASKRAQQPEALTAGGAQIQAKGVLVSVGTGI